MNRRDLMLLGAAALVMPRMALADMLAYQPGLPEERLAAGETVFLDFYATWCSTCRAQDRIVSELRAANPAYDAAMTFIRVDWDTYGTSEFARALSIPRRSTLVLMRGEAELGRIVAGTGRDEIEALLNLGLT